jgi:hypothetical protein
MAVKTLAPSASTTMQGQAYRECRVSINVVFDLPACFLDLLL